MAPAAQQPEHPQCLVRKRAGTSPIDSHTGRVYYIVPADINRLVGEDGVFLSRPRDPTRNADSPGCRPFLCIKSDERGHWLLPLTSRDRPPLRYRIMGRHGGVRDATWTRNESFVNDMRTYYIVPAELLAAVTCEDRYNANEEYRPYVSETELDQHILPLFYDAIRRLPSAPGAHAPSTRNGALSETAKQSAHCSHPTGALPGRHAVHGDL